MAAPTCPYCNASLTGVSAAAGDRPRCPRCGEPLPAAVAQQLDGAVPAASSTPAAAVPGRKRTALAILGIMALMATIGLSYALWTTTFRRDNDYRTRKGTPIATASTSPSAALSLLPARSNVVASIDVADLLKSPAARRLLDEPRPAPLDWLLAGLEKWTGLKPGDLDHVVLGAELRTTLPRLTVVVQTRQPYAPHKIAERLAPAQPTKHRQKLLVRFPLQSPLAPGGRGFAGEGLLWCHSDRVLALVLCLDAAKTEDLDGIPSQPRPGLEGFAAPVREAIETRLDKQSVLWLAGHLEEASVVTDALALFGTKTKAWSPLFATKTFAVGLVPEEGLTLVGHFFTGDVQSARSLEKWLDERRPAAATSYKVEGPPAAAAATDAWVTLQMRGDVEALRATISGR